ncbi:kinase-like protein [Neolentinus lepideus HHB14362 ss-1]|uniref:Kinase-like protein n=1 Tax=Neolentinus lepideus HHB14362 ss-1 TaxID=1314782 RepID=A0A165U0T1_9AGAM|nr:kinase-like protein [Neolentinus lepideus HHB14362 ss-1]
MPDLLWYIICHCCSSRPSDRPTIVELVRIVGALSKGWSTLVMDASCAMQRAVQYVRGTATDCHLITAGLEDPMTQNTSSGDELVQRILVDYRRQNDTAAFNYLYVVLSSTEYRRAVSNLRGCDADTFFEILVEVQRNPTIIEDRDTDHLFEVSSVKSTISRLLVALALQCGQNPPALLLQAKVELVDRDPIAWGGFADVYLGILKGRHVAVKRLRAHQLAATDAIHLRKALLREAIIWHQLQHDNILPFLGIDCDSITSMFCMVSPWMKNGTIINFLHRKGAENVDILLLEIARGLRYLHGEDIVHGDLRGGNIFIDDGGHVRLADFGLTRLADQTRSSTTTSPKSGSTRWMAPELHFYWMSSPQAVFQRTFSSDIYAYGCVCIELFTGEPPFPDIPEIGFEYRMSQGLELQRDMVEIHAKRRMHDLLWHIVCSCCSSRPNNRPDAVELVQLALSSSFIEDAAHFAAGAIASCPASIVVKPVLQDTISPPGHEESIPPSRRRAQEASFSQSSRVPFPSSLTNGIHANPGQNVTVCATSYGEKNPNGGDSDTELECSSKLELARMFKEFYDRAGKQEDLDQTIKLYEEVLHLRPAPHPERPWTLRALFVCLDEEYHKSKDPEVLERAIALLREATRLCEHPDNNQTMDLVTLQGDLGYILVIRHDYMGRQEDLDEAEKLLKEVLRQRPVPHPRRAWTLHELSLCLKRQSDESGDLGLLERALDLQREAISLCEQPHAKQDADLVPLRSHYGISLQKRYDRLGQREDVDEAIKLFEEVLDSPPSPWVPRVETLTSLRKALECRYEKFRDPAALERLKEVVREIAPLRAAEVRKS